MSLGMNDCLGVPTRGGSPASRIIMTSGSAAPFASTNTNILTLTTQTLNESKGEFEYIIDPIYGDKVIPKKAGIYKLRSSITQSGANPHAAIVKNLPLGNGATSPETIFATNDNKKYFLAYARTATAFPGERIATCRLEPGDVVQFFYTNTGSTTAAETIIEIEYLGG